MIYPFLPFETMQQLQRGKVQLGTPDNIVIPGQRNNINPIYAQSTIANWPVKVSNIAGVQQNKFTKNCHHFGSPSGTVLLRASATEKSTSRWADNFWGKCKAICLVVITKPWQ
jgi:hypothetical protein